MKFSIANLLLPASAVIATATLVSGQVQVSLQSIVVFLYIYLFLLVSEFLAQPVCMDLVLVSSGSPSTNPSSSPSQKPSLSPSASPSEEPHLQLRQLLRPDRPRMYQVYLLPSVLLMTQHLEEQV